MRDEPRRSDYLDSKRFFQLEQIPITGHNKPRSRGQSTGQKNIVLRVPRDPFPERRRVNDNRGLFNPRQQPCIILPRETGSLAYALVLFQGTLAGIPRAGSGRRATPANTRRACALIRQPAAMKVLVSMTMAFTGGCAMHEFQPQWHCCPARVGAGDLSSCLNAARNSAGLRGLLQRLSRRRCERPRRDWKTGPTLPRLPEVQQSAASM